MSRNTLELSLLLASAAAGIILALISLVEVEQTSLPDGVVAKVNDTYLSQDEYQSLLTRRVEQGASPQTVLETLDFMIDEELLLQRGEELGLVRRDSTVRAALIRAVEKSIVSEERSRIPKEEDLKSYFSENMDKFQIPPRYKVDQIFVEEMSDELLAAMAEADDPEFDNLKQAFNGRYPRRVPPVPLSEDALQRFYPENIVSALMELPVGVVSKPIESPLGIHILIVKEVIPGSTPSFEDVYVEVENEYALHRDRVAYEEYLSWLRSRAEVEKAEEE